MFGEFFFSVMCLHEWKQKKILYYWERHIFFSLLGLKIKTTTIPPLPLHHYQILLQSKWSSIAGVAKLYCLLLYIGNSTKRMKEDHNALCLEFKMPNELRTRRLNLYGRIIFFSLLKNFFSCGDIPTELKINLYLE